MKLTLKAPGCERLRLCDMLLSTYGCKFSLRRYITKLQDGANFHLAPRERVHSAAAGAYTRPFLSLI